MPWNGRGDPAVVHDVLDRDHVAQHRVPLEGRVLGLGRHDRGERLLGHVVLVHVALGQEAVAADGGEAVGRLVGAVAHLAGHRDHPRGADARAGVVAAHAEDGLGQAGVDRQRRLHRHERGGGAADGDRGEVAGLHPEVVGEGRRVHQRRLDEGERGDHPVNVGEGDAGVVEGDLGHLGEELERAAALKLALLGLPHPGDDDALAEHSPGLGQVGRGLAHPSSSCRLSDQPKGLRARGPPRDGGLRRAGDTPGWAGADRNPTGRRRVPCGTSVPSGRFPHPASKESPPVSSDPNYDTATDTYRQIYRGHDNASAVTNSEGLTVFFDPDTQDVMGSDRELHRLLRVPQDRGRRVRDHAAGQGAGTAGGRDGLRRRGHPLRHPDRRVLLGARPLTPDDDRPRPLAGGHHREHLRHLVDVHVNQRRPVGGERLGDRVVDLAGVADGGGVDAVGRAMPSKLGWKPAKLEPA